MHPKPTPALNKPVHFLSDEIAEIIARLVIRTAEEREADQPVTYAMKPYVQWSKNNLQPLDKAIENLVLRVRETTKADEKVLTRAESVQLEELYDRYRQKLDREAAAIERQG